MTVPAGFPYPMKQEVEIPLEQIIPNPNQPRKFQDKEAIQLLAASMLAKGQDVAARVRPLTEEEQTAHPGAWVMLIGGHGRREAALLNQFKTLKCTVEDIAPGETLSTAARDNTMRPMHWWEWYLIFEAVDKAGQKSRKDIANEFGQYETKVHNALKVTKTLNPASRALVQENIQKSLISSTRTPSTKNKAFSITESHLLVLADLEDPGQVQQALQAVLDDYLTTDQAQKLVEHIQSGNPAETFNQAPSPKKASGNQANVPAHSHPAHLSPAGSLSLSAEAIPANGHHQGPLAQPSLAPRLEASAQVPPADETNNWFWKWMAGIKFISEVRSKLKKGEPLTRWEKVFALFYGSWEKAKPVLKALNHGLKNTLGKKNYNVLKTVFWVILIWALLWGAGKFWQMVVVNPFHWLEKKTVWAFDGGLWSSKAAPVPSASTPSPGVTQPSVLPKVEAAVVHLIPEKKIEKPASPIKDSGISSHPETQPASISMYQPAVAFIPNPSSPKTLYDPKILELEIASVPKNSIVKDFPLTPDEGMPLDVASSRMQDVIDPDKYTMYIGGSKEIITSVNAGNTTLTILFKSADPLDFWGGKGPINFLWEDVKYIHADEIDILLSNKTVQMIYQCSLVVSGSKYPLTLQCATPEDLEHLVSTLQYFIRHSRLGRDTALGGMPYPTQGVRLNNDCLVEKLWAGSPMDMSGLKCGEMIWSVDANAYYPPDRKKLEAALASLAPGSHAIFVVSAADRDKAQGDAAFGRGKNFNPKRRKAILNL